MKPHILRELLNELERHIGECRTATGEHNRLVAAQIVWADVKRVRASVSRCRNRTAADELRATNLTRQATDYLGLSGLGAEVLKIENMDRIWNSLIV